MITKDESMFISLAKPFTVKGSEAQQALFNWKTMAKFELDQDQNSFIRELDGTKRLSEILKGYDSSSQEIARDLLAELKKMEALYFSREPHERLFVDLARDPHLQSVHFELTKKCNMKCLHCYQESYMNDSSEDDLSTSEIEQIAADMKKMNVEKIGISGGEPFMRSDLFHLLNIMEENEIAISSILTNGIKLNEESIEKIRSFGNRCTIFVSLDGLNYEAMKLRGFKRGEDRKRVFNKIVGNIKKALRSDISIMINTAVTNQNVNDLCAMYDWFRQMGVKGWRVALPKMAGAFRNNQSSFFVDRGTVFAAYLKLIKRHFETHGPESDFRLQIEHFFRMEVFDGLELLSPQDAVCDYEGKKESCCIKPNGNITPCPLYLDLIIGNLKNSRLEDAWYSKRMQDIKEICIYDVVKCRGCQLSSICATGCRANANFIHGSIYELDDDACAATKFFLEKVVPLLKENDVHNSILEKMAAEFQCKT